VPGEGHRSERDFRKFATAARRAPRDLKGMTKSYEQHGMLLAYPFPKIENAKQIRGGCREIPHGVGRDASYPRAAATALRATGYHLPCRPERSFLRENDMPTNPVTGKK
jgi:hypothetical protein